MRARLVAATFLLCLAPALSAHAKEFTFKQAGVTIDIPKKWKTEPAGKTSVTFSTRDGTTAINLTVVTGMSLEEAHTNLTEQVGKLLSDATFTNRKDGAIGGMRGYVSQARGDMEGMPMEAALTVLNIDGKKTLIVFALGAKGQYEKHGDDLTRTLLSIAPVGGAPLTDFGPFSSDDLNGLDRDGQRAVVSFAKSILENDDPAFMGFIAKKGLTLGKKKFKRSQMAEYVGSEGPQGLFKEMQWDLESWRVDVQNKRTVWVFNGSGYGDTAIAILKKSGKQWHFVAAKSVDLGSP